MTRPRKVVGEMRQRIVDVGWMRRDLPSDKDLAEEAGCTIRAVQQIMNAALAEHPRSGTSTYVSWQGMLTRCRNPNFAKYHDYGGRGIVVCERWLSYDNFLADMGERPPGKTLDRIDNEMGYTPENCRWATALEQANNKRPRKIVD